MNKLGVLLLTAGFAFTASAEKLTRFECEYTMDKKEKYTKPDGSSGLRYIKNKFLFFISTLEDNAHSSFWLDDEDTYLNFFPKKNDPNLTMLSENLSESVKKTEIEASGDGDGEASNKLNLNRYPDDSKDWEGDFYYEDHSPDNDGIYYTWKTQVTCTTSESDSDQAKAEIKNYTEAD